MTELVQIWAVVLSSIVALAFIIAMFACRSGESNYESFIKAWKERRLAEFEVEKAKLEVEKAKYGLGK